MEIINVNGEEYVKKSDVNFDSLDKNNPEIIKDYVIVRTYSAGVHAGNLVERNGKEVKLKNARRLWYWEGAASLSQLAMEGVSKPENCKFPCEVTEISLTEAIEVIPCTEKAIKSIKGVETWEE